MIDNDQSHEEYKLDDLDLLASEPEDQLQPETETANASMPDSERRAQFWESSVIRNGLIAIGCLVLLFFCYKLIGSFFPSNDSAENEITPVAVATNVHPVVKSFPEEQTDVSALNKKFSTLEQDQKIVKSNIETINSQMATVTNSVGDVAMKLTELNNTIAAMNAKIDAQTQEINRLVITKTKKQYVPRRHVVHTNNQSVVYSLQAVIPGRAWLITNSGATLTVREGTLISGYGVVKLIDPQQGRVITSSGRVIRFSQVDS